MNLTAGAVAALADASQHTTEFLTRHVRGDWGEFGHFDAIQLTDDERRRGWEAIDDSGKINKSNVLNHRDRVMSACQGRGLTLARASCATSACSSISCGEIGAVRAMPRGCSGSTRWDASGVILRYRHQGQTSYRRDTDMPGSAVPAESR